MPLLSGSLEGLCLGGELIGEAAPRARPGLGVQAGEAVDRALCRRRVEVVERVGAALEANAQTILARLEVGYLCSCHLVVSLPSQRSDEQPGVFLGLLGVVLGDRDIREGLEHGRRQCPVLVEDVGALLGLVTDGLPVGLIVAVAARVDLQAHAAGLAYVQVVLLAHTVLAGTELDRHVLVEEYVGDPQQLLTRVDEVGEMVDTATVAGRVPNQAEVVRSLADRRHAEHGEVWAIGDRRVLHVALPERVAVPPGVAVGITGRDRHVVDAADSRPTRHVALRPVRERRLHAGRRHETLHVPEDLMQMPAWAAVTEGAAVTDGVLIPALTDTNGLEPGDGVAKCARAGRAPTDVTEAGLRSLGQLQGVVETIAPGAQIGRLPDPRGLLETNHISPELERLFELRRRQFDVRQLRQQRGTHLNLSSSVTRDRAGFPPSQNPYSDS